jgi:hypothetical protein
MALMTYSTKRLTEELQRSVALRGTTTKNACQTAPLPQGRFEVSSEATAYVNKMRTYREQAKSVRIGRY